MDSRDDLARVLEREFGAFLAHDPYKPDVFWGLRADAIRAAGWVPGELLATEQARNATLADTIQRVEALCDQGYYHRDPRGAFVGFLTDLRDALDGPDDQEDG